MYEFVPAPGTKLSKITALSNDLAMSLQALRVRGVMSGLSNRFGSVDGGTGGRARWRLPPATRYELVFAASFGCAASGIFTGSTVCGTAGVVILLAALSL